MRPITGDVIDHRHKGIEVVRGAPGNAHTKLDHYRIGDNALFDQFLGKPQVARVEGLNFNLNTQVSHALGHIPKHAWGVGHDVVGFSKIHGAAVEGRNFGEACL